MAYGRIRPTLLRGAALSVLLAGMVAAAHAEEPKSFSSLPPELKALYVGVEDTLQPSAYDGFKMPPKPW